jgi:hypothetical protein
MRDKRLKFVRLLLFAGILAPNSWSIAEAAITLTCPVNIGTVTIPYSSKLTADGGVAPYTISITKGALPAGLMLNATSGAITGTPTTAGKATFTAKVVDSLVAGAGGSPDSTTADCEISIAAAPPCTVGSLVFAAKDSPLDANPNTGGGQRIFAERRTATGALLNVVKVNATTNPVVKGKEVFFKSFDVDDPSSDDAPIDPNGRRGNDNRGFPMAGRLSSTAAMTDDNGVATVEFTTTRQPGDNFKVAASCSLRYLDGVDLNDTDGSIIQDSLRTALPTAHDKLTQMLTVWRRVHVEVDAMQRSAGNFYTGRITGVTRIFGVTFIGTNLAGMEPGRLENGRLVVGANSYGITSNTAGIILASVAVPATEVGKEFTAYDDDDFNENDGANKRGDTGEALVAPDASLVQDSDNPAMNLLAPAYVRPTYDLPNPTPNPPFVVNQAGDTGADVIALYKFDNRASNSNDYWVIYMLGAYQAITTEDQDPNTEAATSGRVDAVRGQGAVTYLELVSAHELAVLDKHHEADPDPFCRANLANWNQTFRNAPTTAHEVGHLFGGLHTDRGLMADKCPQATLTFSDATIAKARATARP